MIPFLLACRAVGGGGLPHPFFSPSLSFPALWAEPLSAPAGGAFCFAKVSPM
jgi:hypothetical protein